jgi:hypothetical protein
VMNHLLLSILLDSSGFPASAHTTYAFDHVMISCRMMIRPWRMHLPASLLQRLLRPLHHLQQQPPQTPTCQMPQRTRLLQMPRLLPPSPTK